MPAPLDPAKRAAITADIRAGGGRNAIARKHDVGPSTVKVEKLERLDLGGGIEEAAGLIRDLVDSIRGG
jgi:transposase-like protein